jgi:hypothetical protein
VREQRQRRTVPASADARDEIRALRRAREELALDTRRREKIPRLER